MDTRAAEGRAVRQVTSKERASRGEALRKQRGKKSRGRSSRVSTLTTEPAARRLPAIMRERPVGLGHPVGVFLFLDRVPLALGGQDQLRRQPLRHRLFGAGPREGYEPAHGQGGPAVRRSEERSVGKECRSRWS